MSNEQNKISDIIAGCAKNAFNELFKNKEHFYYCVLLTTGEGFSPIISAWSWEAFDKIKESLPKNEADMIKWSYADSPYYNFGEEYFKPVKHLFEKRSSIDELDDESWEKELDFRVNAITLAMKKIDDLGVFGLNQPRSEVYINVEFMPPDETNTQRALFLNEKENISDWLREASE